MKRSTLRFGVLIFTAMAIVVVAILVVTNRVQAQGEIVSSLTDLLSKQSVPFKDVRVASPIPFTIEVAIQSSSPNATVAPEDPLFENTILHDAALLQGNDGLTIDRIKVTIINTDGATIYQSETPVRKAIAVQSPNLDDASTAALVKADLDLTGMILDKLEITSDPTSGRLLRIQLSVANAEQATSAIQTFVPKLSNLTDRLNSQQGAQIAICQVVIFDTSQNVLFKYVRDIQLSQENWWQSPDITHNWAPGGPPPTQSAAPTAILYGKP